MALNDKAQIVQRVIIKGDYSYPQDYSISYKKAFMGVMTYLMGSARQDGLLELVSELEGRLRVYRTRLDQEIRAMQMGRSKSALFTTTDLKRTAEKEPWE